jgi:hypothetical protein
MKIDMVVKTMMMTCLTIQYKKMGAIITTKINFKEVEDYEMGNYSIS